MRWKKRGVIIATCVVLLVGLVGGCWIVESVQTRAFFEKYELVNAMKQSTEGIDPWKTDPRALRRNVLLGRIALGTTQAETIRVLSSEGFACRKWGAPPPRSKIAFDCSLSGNHPSNVGRWLIQLDFDDAQRLANANVMILK